MTLQDGDLSEQFEEIMGNGRSSEDLSELVQAWTDRSDELVLESPTGDRLERTPNSVTVMDVTNRIVLVCSNDGVVLGVGDTADRGPALSPEETKEGVSGLLSNAIKSQSSDDLIIAVEKWIGLELKENMLMFDGGSLKKVSEFKGATMFETIEIRNPRKPGETTPVIATFDEMGNLQGDVTFLVSEPVDNGESDKGPQLPVAKFEDPDPEDALSPSIENVAETEVVPDPDEAELVVSTEVPQFTPRGMRSNSNFTHDDIRKFTHISEIDRTNFVARFNIQVQDSVDGVISLYLKLEQVPKAKEVQDHVGLSLPTLTKLEGHIVARVATEIEDLGILADGSSVDMSKNTWDEEDGHEAPEEGDEFSDLKGGRKVDYTIIGVVESDDPLDFDINNKSDDDDLENISEVSASALYEQIQLDSDNLVQETLMALLHDSIEPDGENIRNISHTKDRIKVVVLESDSSDEYVQYEYDLEGNLQVTRSYEQTEEASIEAIVAEPNSTLLARPPGLGVVIDEDEEKIKESDKKYSIAPIGGLWEHLETSPDKPLPEELWYFLRKEMLKPDERVPIEIDSVQPGNPIKVTYVGGGKKGNDLVFLYSPSGDGIRMRKGKLMIQKNTISGLSDKDSIVSRILFSSDKIQIDPTVTINASQYKSALKVSVSALSGEFKQAFQVKLHLFWKAVERLDKGHYCLRELYLSMDKAAKEVFGDETSEMQELFYRIRCMAFLKVMNDINNQQGFDDIVEGRRKRLVDLIETGTDNKYYATRLIGRIAPWDKEPRDQEITKFLGALGEFDSEEMKKVLDK